MTMKSIATYAALAIIGAAVDGLTSMAIPTGPAA